MALANTRVTSETGSAQGTIGDKIGTQFAERLIRVVQSANNENSNTELIEGLVFPITDYSTVATAINRLVKFFYHEDGVQNDGFFSNHETDYKLIVRKYILGIKEYFHSVDIETIACVLWLFNRHKVARVKIHKQAEFLKEFSARGPEEIELFIDALLTPFGLEKVETTKVHGITDTRKVKAWDPVMSLKSPLYLEHRIDFTRIKDVEKKGVLGELVLADINKDHFDKSNMATESD